MGSGGSTPSRSRQVSDGTAVYTQKRFHKTYILGIKIGDGAFSVVHEAIHKINGGQFAVKVIDKRNLVEKDLACLRMEIEILSKLDHPNIIKLVEVFDEDSHLYIVTELVQGGELFDRIIKRSHYTEDKARDLIVFFLKSMEYIHLQGIVHRDIKAENLLLVSEESDADVKICDFGMAKRVVDLSPPEEPCGTPGYVAPEVLRQLPYSTEVDIWSVGVLCYILLVGYPPFYDEDSNKLFKKIKDGKFLFHAEFWDKISPGAIDLIKKMLCLDQRERWTASQLLQHPWILADAQELSKNDLSTTIAEMKRFNARRRLRAAANAVIIANRMSNIVKGLGKAAGQPETGS
jgi:serine/threonine protein kinase